MPGLGEALFQSAREMRRIRVMADQNALSNDELELRWKALYADLDQNGVAACIAAIRSESSNDRRTSSIDWLCASSAAELAQPLRNLTL